MKITVKNLMQSVDFVKCEEYNPYHPKANSLGMRSFWRADYKGNSIAYGDTKAECVKYARNYLVNHRENGAV